MIILYRKKHSPLADEIQEGLRDIVIAHEVKMISDTDDNPYPKHELPVLVDEGKPVSGELDLRKKVKELGRVMEVWDLFKSDACFVDDDINTCEE